MNKCAHAMQLLTILWLWLNWKTGWSCSGISVEAKINILNLKSWLRWVDQSWLTLWSQICTHVIVHHSWDTLSVIGTWHVRLAINQERISCGGFSTKFNVGLNLKSALDDIRFTIVKWRSHVDLGRIIFISVRWYNHGFSKALQEWLDIVLILFFFFQLLVRLDKLVYFLDDFQAAGLIVFKLTIG